MNDFDDLGAVLDRATDNIERHFDPADVLARARRRRVRQRGIVAVAVTATAVVAVAVSVQAVGGDQATREVPPATRTPTESVGPPWWVPRAVESLPAASGDVAPLLPAVMKVPDLAPHVEDDPVDAAVLSVDDGVDVLLLGSDGRWRCVVVPGKSQQPRPALSPGGTSLAVATSGGFVTVDLATGTQSHRSLPSGFVPAGGPAWMWWLDERRLLIIDGAGGWEIDVERGTEDRVENPKVPDGDWAQPPTGPGVNPAVRAVAELADGSVLLRVAPPRRGDRTGWWLVRWDPASDEFSLVTATDSDPDKAASFARDLVGRS